MSEMPMSNIGSEIAPDPLCVLGLSIEQLGQEPIARVRLAVCDGLADVRGKVTVARGLVRKGVDDDQEVVIEQEDAAFHPRYSRTNGHSWNKRNAKHSTRRTL